MTRPPVRVRLARLPVARLRLPSLGGLVVLALPLVAVPALPVVRVPAAWVSSGARTAPDAAGTATAVVVVVDPLPFERLLRVPTFRRLAAAGGAGLMTSHTGGGDRELAAYHTLAAGRVESDVRPARLLADHAGVRAGGVSICGAGRAGRPPRTSDPVAVLWRTAAGAGRCARGEAAFRIEVRDARGRPREAGRLVERLLRRFRERTLVLVVSPFPSPAMAARGDEVTPIVTAAGSGPALLRDVGDLGALTSDTTRKKGLVSSVDVVPTVLGFLDIPIPAEVEGSPIRAVEGPAPFDLHRRHLEYRRIRFPLQLGELAFVVLGAVVALGTLVAYARGARISRGLAAGVRLLAVFGSALPIAVLAGGSLPRFTWLWVVTFLLAATAAVAALALAVRPGPPPGPFVVVGFVALALFAVDAALGTPAMRMPLFGGTMFDGVRFYGLPNGFIPLLLAGAMFVAAELPPRAGTAVVVGAALFAGFPSLGANVGGSITLFTAAGLWWVLRTREGFGLRELSFVAGTVAGGLAAVLLANRFLPGAPTHAGRLAGSGLSGAAEAFVDRLGIGLGMIADVPAAVLPVAGLAAILVVVARRGGRIGAALAPYPAWRDAIVTLSAAALVAFAVNDTGAAAAGPAFIHAVAGTVYAAMPAAERGVNR